MELKEKHMRELATLPTSIRQRLEMASSLMDQNRPNEAETVLRQAGMEMARSNPELCALIMVALQGHRGFTSTTVEVRESVERIEHKFLGIPIAEEWVPVTTRITIRRAFSIF